MEEKNTKSVQAQREEKILEFWKENNTFQKSLEKESPKGEYVFYDGPPFATGVPHYGHILGSTAKDVIGRYQTMKGFRVPRRWGWDCHGLPIENIVEKNLGISGRKAIEEYGVDKFSEEARSSVLKYVGEWKKTVDRMGRWVDFDNSYKTMDNSFIESVWWALGQLNDKGLLYEGVRVLAYCPRCETPIANSEIAMDNSYKDITVISVYVKFRLNPTQKMHPLFNASTLTRSDAFSAPEIFLLAWTTTPWTLPGNTAIAINKDLTYLFVKNQKENGEEILVVVKDLFENLKDKFNNPEILKEVKGDELVGLSYEPVFDYYKNSEVAKNPNIWKVWHADFVNAEKGTGIAHEAPAFGEDDMNLAKMHDIPFIRHVEPNGFFTKEISDFQGLKAKPKDDPQSTDVAVIKYLAHSGVLFAKEKIIHSYPHCYRCDTPLLYYALPSWFVNIQKVKNDLIESAKTMEWIPGHLKEGRFKYTMEGAPDWTISRNRFWASPLPIWKSDDGEMLFISSFDDLKKHTPKSGNKYFVMRHGEAAHNIDGLISDDENAPDHLTDNGRDQVSKSAKDFLGKKIDLIFVSPFVRTRDTADIVSGELGIQKENIIVDNRLHEFQIGNKDFRTWREYHDALPKTVENFAFAYPGGESYQDMKNRVMDFMYDIENKYQDKNILIITHGGPSWLLMAGSMGYTAEETLSMVKDKKDFHYLNNAEYYELDFVKIPHDKNYNLDFHRPYIDDVILEKDGKSFKRIPEVIDCWFESGSMPFAQDHYPFENPDWQKKNFPAGFVAEYIAQTRTWFYYTHTISTILFGKSPFEHVVTTGTVLAEDGQKMSKSKNNFPDPWIIFNKFGVDALRFYLMVSPVMKGEDVNFSEKGVQDVASKIINRLDNVLAFYELYRDTSIEGVDVVNSKNVLDSWILARYSNLVSEVTVGMESYDMAQATKPFESFVDDLSTWYLRRSREALKDGDIDAKKTLYFVLKNTAKLIAPFAPFVAEDIWQKLKNENDAESVHLADWPNEVESRKWQVESILDEMQEVREVVTLGLQSRQKAGVPVRQPLGRFGLPMNIKSEYIDIIKDELNVKEIVCDSTLSDVVMSFDITPELKLEGNYRELVRAVQDMRKKSGLMPSDMINLYINTDDQGKNIVEKFKDDFSKTVGVKSIEYKDMGGEEVKIDSIVFIIKIEK